MMCIACNLKRNEADEIKAVMMNKGYNAEIRLDIENRTAVFANVDRTDWARAKHSTDYPEKH